MITHPDLRQESSDDLAARIATRTRADVQHWFDAEATTTDLLGRSTTANIFVIGTAVQAGCIPIDPARIEEAIALNGVAVASNVEAFRWGRWAVADADRLAAARGSSGSAPELRSIAVGDDVRALTDDPRLQQVLARLADEVELWGSPRDRRSYVQRLSVVADAERAADPSSTVLLEATGRGLHKLTAYKDEYEVARLMLDTDASEATAEVGAGRSKVAWKLHPPMLRSAGMRRKIAISTRFAPAIRLLAGAKALRGTLLDPFRWAEVRRVERRLTAEYWSALESALDHLDPTTMSQVVRVAESADLVRGYEDIKLANVERFRSELARRREVFVS